MIIWVRNYGGSGWRIPVVAGDYPAPAPPGPALCFNGCCTVLGKRRKYTAGSNNSSCKKKESLPTHFHVQGKTPKCEIRKVTR